MTPDQLANTPAKLVIEGLDGSGQTATRSFVLCRSLPAAAALALDRDLIDLGKRTLTPYHRAKPQLDALATMAENAATPKDRALLLSDRQAILERITDGLLSGRADDLAQEAYWDVGRKSIEGVRREVAERVKHAGGTVAIEELAAIITAGNVGKVHADMVTALEDTADPSTPAISVG